MSDENTLEKLKKNATKMTITMKKDDKEIIYGPFMSDIFSEQATLGGPSDDPKYSLFNTSWRMFFRILLGALVFLLFIGNNNIIYFLKKKLKGNNTPEPSEGNYSICTEVPLTSDATDDNQNTCTKNLDYKKNNCDYVAPRIDEITSGPIAESCNESEKTKTERKTANFLILIMGSVLFLAELFNYYRMSNTPESEKGIKYKIVSTLSIIYTICLLWPILTSLCMIIDNINEPDCSTFMYIGIGIVVVLIIYVLKDSGKSTIEKVKDSDISFLEGAKSVGTGAASGLGSLASGTVSGLGSLASGTVSGITGLAGKAQGKIRKS